MLCIYLLYIKPYAALVSQTEQILPPKTQKLRKYYLFTDYAQKHDEKSENFEWIPKKVGAGNWQFQYVLLNVKKVAPTQLSFICSKSTIESLEKCVKYVQS